MKTVPHFVISLSVRIRLNSLMTASDRDTVGVQGQPWSLVV